MKKILLVFAFLILFFPKNILACSVPPDILYEWKVDTKSKNLNIMLTIFAWKNLHSQIQELLEKNSWKHFSEKNLEKILKTEILPLADFSLNNQKIDLHFLSGSIAKQNQNIDEFSYQPEIFLQAEFSADKIIDFSQLQHISLTFDKTPFLEISPLLHPYIVGDFQKNSISETYVLDENHITFDVFKDENHTFVTRNQNEEWSAENIFDWYAWPLTDAHKSPFSLSNFAKNHQNSPIKVENSDEKIDFFAPGNTLKNFFDKKISFSLKIFGIFIALLSGMGHGLLPWHSKSLLIGYVANGGKIRKKEIFTLIASVTFSHTFFIILLAIIIVFLQKWTSFSAQITANMSSILYILFGIFFVWQGAKFFRKSENIFTNFGNTKHSISCNCCQSKNLKNTIFVGFLAGLVPCIDALALFVSAISIGNILYSSLIIIAFSIGIGIMLGIIAYSLDSGKNILYKKWNNFAQKFSKILTLFAGIILIFIGLFHFL